MRIGQRGFVTLEIVLLVMVLVAAFLVMQIYMKRAMEGRLRAISDDLGDQYSPRHTTGVKTYLSSGRQETVTRSQSEQMMGMDLDGDGTVSPFVYGTDSVSVDHGTNTRESLNERVAPLATEKLFE